MKNKMLLVLISLACFQASTVYAKEIGSDQRLTNAIRSYPPADDAKIKDLIKRGADVNARDASDKTALHWAASYRDDISILMALIEAGADVNAQDNLLMTPLHHAALVDNPHAIKALIVAGADIHAKNKADFTPLELAKEYDIPEVLKAFGVATK